MAAVLIAIGIAVLIALSYVANEEHRRQRAAWLAAGRRVGLEPIGQGTLAAVERLLRLKCDGRLEPLRGAAIAAIQKHSAGEQGWLTLAPDSPSDGALSTADDMGTLAIAEPEKD